MSIICLDPLARNYNANDSTPCIYTIRKPSGCYTFKESTFVKKDRSYTISFDTETKNWVFFHSYTPDMYVHDRDKLYSIKGTGFYRHNEGISGGFYDDMAIEPFYIDMVFAGGDAILDTIGWVSSLWGTTGEYKEFSTFTHLMVWNSVQCTGYISLDDIIRAPDTSTVRKTMSTFTFSDLHDALINRTGEFLTDIFGHYNVNFTPDDVPWYDKALLKDNYFVIRLMHWPIGDRIKEKMMLHDISIDKTETPR